MEIARYLVIFLLYGYSVLSRAQDGSQPPACGTAACTDGTNGFSVGSDPEEYTCPSLVNAYPMFCSPDHSHSVATHCCATCCQSTCIDSSKMVRVQGRDVSCEEMVNEVDPFYCKMSQFRASVYTQCCQSCQPYRSACLDTTQDVPVGDGAEAMSCAELVTEWPAYCRDERIGGADGLCCQSCSQIDLDCLDTVGAPYTIEGADVTCADLAEGYVHFCVQEGVQDKCCGACRPVIDAYNAHQSGNTLSEDQVELLCRDTVMSFPLYRGGPTVTCDDIAEDYQVYCQYSWYSGYLGRCCHTCASVDLSCIDYPESVLPVLPDIGQAVSCGRLASRHAYFCKVLGGQVNPHTSNYCCQSCRAVDTTCMDKPGKVVKPERGSSMRCSQLVNTPVLCVQYGDLCCETCRDVDTTCTDALGKVVSVPGVNKEMTCVDAAQSHPYACTLPGMAGDGGLCCQACSDVDVGCTDKPGKWIELWPNKMGYCTNLPDYPYLCSVHGEDCCVSCMGIDTTCTDVPHKTVPVVDATGETSFRTCESVAEQYAYLCLHEEYGGEGGLCCAACSTADTSCANLAGGHLEIAAEDKLLSCGNMVRSWPKLCREGSVSDEHGSCCLACRSVTQESLFCADEPHYSLVPHEGFIPMNCRDLASMFGRLCVPGVNEEVRSNCCYSCNNRADLECNNDPDYIVTVKMSGVKKCKSCHCQELLWKSRRTLEAACCTLDTAALTQAHCCKECARVDC